MSDTLIGGQQEGQQQGQQGQQQGGAKAWYDGAPQEVAAFVQTKGWDNPLKVVDSYRSLEKMLGADKVVIPGKDAKPDEWNAVWNKLGRPEAPDKYQFPQVEGVELDKGKVDAVAKLMHENGLTQTQAERLFNWYASDMKGALDTHKQSEEQRKTQAAEALKGEWKDKYEAQLDLAKRAFNTFADDKLKEYVASSGLGDNPDFIRLMNRIGAGMMEDTAHGRAAAGGFATGSPAAAQAEINSLRQDKDFMATLFNGNAVGNKQAREKWNQLFKMAYPDKPLQSE